MVPVTANIATHKARKEVLPKMIASISSQVDVVRVYCNDYAPDLSLEEEYDNLELYHGPDDYTDRVKFMWVSEDPEIYCTMDDDILYPPDYVDKLLKGLNKYPNSVVTFHGRRLKGKNLNYYHGHKAYQCLRTVDGDRLIDIPGSGVAAFDTRRFTPNILQYEHDCMADILLGLEAARAGVSVVCLQHDMWWLKSLWNPNKGSIYQSEKNDCEVQNRMADEVWGIRY